jgi:hypothetical protein
VRIGRAGIGAKSTKMIAVPNNLYVTDIGQITSDSPANTPYPKTRITPTNVAYSMHIVSVFIYTLVGVAAKSPVEKATRYE